VHEAGLRGLRLILVLTNGGSAAGGGMQQFTDWVDPALTVSDFYTNDTVKVRGGGRRPLWRRTAAVLRVASCVRAANSIQSLFTRVHVRMPMMHTSTHTVCVP
jgi:hypothetical protein